MATIRVCATTANLGSGFDCLGAALSIYNNITIEEIEKGLEITSKKELENLEDNLIYKSIVHTLNFLQKEVKGIKIIENNDVPISRGLGSSAACIVAGVLGAMLITKTEIDKELVLKLSTELEGHPDNVAAAIFGGITVCVDTKDKIIYQQIYPKNGLNFYAMVPDFKLQTRLSREALPTDIPFRDAVFSAGRTALLVASLMNEDYKNLRYCFEDKLHQNYRSSLIKGYDQIFDGAYQSGADGVYLSGAGPTIMAVSRFDIEEKLKAMLKNVEGNWEVKVLQIDNEGVKYEHDCS